MDDHRGLVASALVLPISQNEAANSSVTQLEAQGFYGSQVSSGLISEPSVDMEEDADDVFDDLL